jgi:hypothetical protein
MFLSEQKLFLGELSFLSQSRRMSKALIPYQPPFDYLDLLPDSVVYRGNGIEYDVSMPFAWRSDSPPAPTIVIQSTTGMILRNGEVVEIQYDYYTKEDLERRKNRGENWREFRASDTIR